MKRTKKVLALVLTLAMVFTMAGFSQTTAFAKGKVKSIKVAKKATVTVGKKKTVKVKIKTKGKKVSKAFTVKVSKKKIVKVTKKKGKIVIKGLKPGKVKVTIKSKANKKKKKTIKVTVVAADITMNATQTSDDAVALSFSKAVNIQKGNVIIQSKKYVNGKYNYVQKISSLYTLDKKVYTATVDDYFSEPGKIKITVTGVNKKAIVKEIEAKRPSYNSKMEYVITGKVNEEVSFSDDLDDFANKGYGRIKSFTGLPSGLSYYVNKDRNFRIKGKPKNTGVTRAKLMVEDETGVTNTIELVFVIGNASKIVTYSKTQVIYGNFGDSSSYYDTSVDIYAGGGSGSYSYNVINKGSIFESSIYDGYWNTEQIKKAGTYVGTYEVEDYYNSSLKAQGKATVQAIQGVVVSGKVTSASGKVVEDASVYVNEKQDIDASYSGYAYTNNKGEYKLCVPKGKYNLRSRVNRTYITISDRNIQSNMVQNIVFGSLYKVTIQATGVNPNYMEDWCNDRNEYYDDGNVLYLEKGNYRLTGYDYYDGYTLKANFTVNGDMTVTATKS